MGKTDPITGRYTGEYHMYALGGFVRDLSEADHALSVLIEADAVKDAEKKEADAKANVEKKNTKANEFD